MNNPMETKELFEKKFQELEAIINITTELDPRSKAVAITNLQTAKMWAVKSIFETSGTRCYPNNKFGEKK